MQGQVVWCWVVLLVCGTTVISACSTQRHPLRQDELLAAADPFDDPFFTQPTKWDESVVPHSEVLTRHPDESHQPPSFGERAQGVMVSILLVGASLGRMALPFLGLGF